MLAATLLLTLQAASASEGEGPYANRPEVLRFVERMAGRHAFDAAALRQLLGGATRQESALAKMAKPAEALGWKQYRSIFLEPERIAAGVQYRRQHQGSLAAAEQKYGVDAAVVLGILGVETRFGHKHGDYRVLDVLVTLAFDYPRRAAYFQKELEHYLLLCREQGFDAAATRGSYAGAMGIGQFMPSSYRAYAVDHDGDGRKDLWSDADAIGSVANYFRIHKWRRGEAVAVRADVEGGAAEPFAKKGVRPTLPLAALRQAGVEPREAIGTNAKVSLHALEGEEGTEYWLGLHNFWVITRYNASALYALAVHQLGAEIVRASGP